MPNIQCPTVNDFQAFLSSNRHIAGRRSREGERVLGFDFLNNVVRHYSVHKVKEGYMELRGVYSMGREYSRATVRTRTNNRGILEKFRKTQAFSLLLFVPETQELRDWYKSRGEQYHDY